MVKIKHLLLSIILLIQSIFIFAQNNIEYLELEKYSRFGLSVGGVLFNKARLSDQFGPYAIEPKPTLSYSFGIIYNLPIHKKWSIETGLFFVHEPSLRFDYTILQKDLPETWDSNIDDKVNAFIMYTTSLPLYLKYSIKINNNSYLNFQAGMKAMLYFPSSSKFVQSIQNDSLISTLLGVKTMSPDSYIHGSFVSGIGYSIATKYVLIQANINYTSNFQSTNKGFYSFINLRESPDSGGKYTLSGDHLSFTITAHFKKSKKKLAKENL